MNEIAPLVSVSGDKDAAMRKEPTQRRSKERVERILSCASTLIADNGSDAMRMSDVAEKAGISIGSLYQYFPDKGSIIRTLADRYNALGRECIADTLKNVHDMNGLQASFAELIDIYYALFLAEPVMRDIWSGTQADKALRDIDLLDSRLNGAVLADARARVDPAADRAFLENSSFLIMHLGQATMHLAISVDPAEGAALVDGFKRMVLREMLAA
ncbi:TetR/AcrR family transcriptional regulator [Phyllobacterium sp. P30BS-XVII]|uniref:TetR/AcrR family transcriptional regulator n=1 Tax=Phyllobacterium sp. P30BS-XVII TaxID=2587046 RepID=UPI000DE07997|nr:TetR/AcrR family transcriptional regulator [Phyllobacterium sp. P30BS-XVII]MBA8902456.1 AcrR family transcriptional regulator [Phyllobacterium sp. P30BS-XVII]